MLIKYRKKNITNVELAPLIDIVFILLIFFAVSSSLISNNQSIPLDLPTASSSETNAPDIIISVKKNRDIYIDSQKISFAQIPPLIIQAMSQNPTTQIIINADKKLDYGFIISLLDKIRLSGCSNIALQVEKKIYK
ncbi:MAG: biopolymer transporter ExbD [Actinobacteria bacterium]|nr:biopolymer transporter ExbD [Actinomycetota bacterium]|tara:strand:+ start:17254 stop:17661 length:408 start_codon:yes stop_codon:yes gene_type:complete